MLLQLSRNRCTRYQFYHVFALLITAICFIRNTISRHWCGRAGCFFSRHSIVQWFTVCTHFYPGCRWNQDISGWQLLRAFRWVTFIAGWALMFLQLPGAGGRTSYCSAWSFFGHYHGAIIVFNRNSICTSSILFSSYFLNRFRIAVIFFFQGLCRGRCR